MKRFVIAIGIVVTLLLVAILWSVGAPSTDERNNQSRWVAATVISTNADPTQEQRDVPAMSFHSPASNEERAISTWKSTDEAPFAGEPLTDLAEHPVNNARKTKDKVTQVPVDLEHTPGERLTLDQTATSDTSLRNADFPRTYISSIRVDLTSPNHWVKLSWAGPNARSQETGPFRSSPGRGLGTNDCDDRDESNRDGSNCTPKGTLQVQVFSDSMPMYSHCRHVTWFQIARGIAFHYYPQVPNYPASHGCVRLDDYAAQLIHNNAKIGATEVIVGGRWKFVR
jgi:hypothetical protein